MSKVHKIHCSLTVVHNHVNNHTSYICTIRGPPCKPVVRKGVATEKGVATWDFKITTFTYRPLTHAQRIDEQNIIHCVYTSVYM